MDIPQSAAGSSRTVSNWFIKALNCKELEIGDVSFEQQKTLISIHTSKVGLAIKALEKREMAGQIVSASIV